MFNHSVIVQTIEAFNNQIATGIIYNDDELIDKTYKWDYAERCVKVNTSNRGYFRIPLPKVNIGDVIKVQFECCRVDGDIPHFSIDYSNSSYINTDVQLSSGLQYITHEGWNKVNSSFIATTDSLYTSCVIGLSTNESGTYKVRHIKIDVNTTRNMDSIEDGSYIIKHDNGIMEQYYKVKKTVDITGAWGQMFGSDVITLPNFKEIFSNNDIICNINVYSTNNSSLIMGNKTIPTKTNPGNICLFRGTAQNNLEIEIHVHAIGKWY